MSMILSLVTLSDANIARILENPPLVWRVFMPHDPGVYLKVLSRDIGNSTSYQSIPDIEIQDGEGEYLDLDKAWHGIHYLLNKTAEECGAPLCFLISGGKQVGDIDVGYGPARAFMAEEVRVIDAALSAVNDDMLRSNFSQTEMIQQEVYPLRDDSKDDETLEYLMTYANILRVAIQRATEYHLGMVLVLT